ncbi:MAG TPA: hypothetical protein ENG45_01030, partial [Candidatus Aenigmarchaeota archaeon]|nr:hypothetical protein [Candidatus Aenigmarchaeota archaeon]
TKDEFNDIDCKKESLETGMISLTSSKYIINSGDKVKLKVLTTTECSGYNVSFYEERSKKVIGKCRLDNEGKCSKEIALSCNKQCLIIAFIDLNKDRKIDANDASSNRIMILVKGGTTSTSTSSTTSSTTSTSTSSTTSTSTTTTTIPEVSLSCDKYSMYTEETNNCTVNNCGDGLWFVYNFEGKPLKDEILGENISKKQSVSFKPLEEGKIKVVAACASPLTTLTKEIVVKKGLDLVCPKECYVDEQCICKVEGCYDGWLIRQNAEKDVVSVSDSPFNYKFVPKERGEVKLTIDCKDPMKEKTVSLLVKGKPKEGFKFKILDCDEEEKVCEINVTRNSLDEDVVLYTYLLDKSSGEIYYTAISIIDAGKTGKVVIDLEKVKECKDARVEALMLAFKESDLKNRIEREKKYVFRC